MNPSPPTVRLFLLLLHNCNFATVINLNVNIWYAEALGGPGERVVWLPKGFDPQVESLLVQRVTVHHGMTKAWWQEQLSPHTMIRSGRQREALGMPWTLWNLKSHPQRLLPPAKPHTLTYPSITAMWGPSIRHTGPWGILMLTTTPLVIQFDSSLICSPGRYLTDDVSYLK